MNFNNDKRYDSYGIYGIYSDDELIYIGKTKRSFRKRFDEHCRVLRDKNKWGDMKLYEKIDHDKKAGKIVRMCVIFAACDVELDKRYVTVLENRDIEAMELFYITIMKPSCNIEGINKPYKLERW